MFEYFGSCFINFHMQSHNVGLNKKVTIKMLNGWYTLEYSSHSAHLQKSLVVVLPQLKFQL